MGALDTAVRQGKALYAGISSLLGPAHPRGRRDPARRWARRCSSTSRATRCSTAGSRRTCSTSSARRASAASPSPRSRRACSPTSTSRACPRVRVRRRASRSRPTLLTEQNLKHIRALERDREGAAASRSPRWRSPGSCATRASRRCSSAPRPSASSRTASARSTNLDFTAEELDKIDKHAVEGGINLWKTLQLPLTPPCRMPPGSAPSGAAPWLAAGSRRHHNSCRAGRSVPPGG